MKFFKLSIFLIISNLALISCGGSSSGSGDDSLYQGATREASVTGDNAQSLAVTSTSGVGQAIVEEGAQDAAFRQSPVSLIVLEFAELLKQDLSTANRTANQLLPGICSSGTVDATQSSDGSQITMLFTNCLPIDGMGEELNGRVVITFDPDDLNNMTMKFNDFTVIFEGQTYTINMSVTCDAVSCSITSEFVGADGRIYRMDNATVEFDGTSYTITAKVYDPDNGYVMIDGQNILFGSCASGVPSSGTITISGSGGSSATVTFTSCSSFSVTLGAETTDYLWDDIL